MKIKFSLSPLLLAIFFSTGALIFGFYVKKEIMSGITAPLGSKLIGEAFSETSVDLPGEIKESNLTENARKASFITKLELGDAVMIWEQGLGLRKISEEGNLEILTHALSKDGNVIIFLAKAKTENQTSIYRWEEGLGLTMQPELELTGSWGISISGYAEKVGLYPKSNDSKARFKSKKINTAFLFSFNAQDDNLILYETLSYADQIILTGNSFSSIKNIGNKSKLKSGLNNSKHQILDLDSDGVEDLLTFNHGPNKPFWRGYTFGQVTGPSENTALLAQKIATWRIGNNQGVPVPGDYNGDGILDFAVYLPNILPHENNEEYNWQIYYSTDLFKMPRVTPMHEEKKLFYQSAYNDVAVPADYDGDGKTDLAIFNKSLNLWKIAYSGCNFNLAKANLQIKGCGQELAWGEHNDIPVLGDYNGDGVSEIALYQEPKKGIRIKGRWKLYYLRSSQGKEITKYINFGGQGDIPVPGDYNCDGATDPAVYSKRKKKWVIRFNKDIVKEVDFASANGENSEPFTGDFDGDGCSDLAFFNSNGRRYKIEILPSSFKPEARKYFPNSLNIVYCYNFTEQDEIPVQIQIRKHQTSFTY